MKKIFATLILSLGLGASLVGTAAPVMACDTSHLTVTEGINCAKGNNQLLDLGSIFSIIANVLIFLVGAIAVIMIIIGGLRYVLSGGSSTAVESAKNQILYSVVGLVVALAAFAIVNFVLSRLGVH